jgi:hypothetical protein
MVSRRLAASQQRSLAVQAGMTGEHDESAGRQGRAIMQMVPRSVADHDAPARKESPTVERGQKVRLNSLGNEEEKALDTERRFTEADSRHSVAFM